MKNFTKILGGAMVLAVSVFFFGGSVFAAGTDDFVITVKTDNPGTSSNTQFTIPTYPGITYNYNVDCDNDGTDEATGQTGDYTCSYASAGTYTIRIKDNSGSGTGFPRIYFNNGGDKEKLLSVNQWGTGKWTSMSHSFYGASNMTVTATDTPDLSNVINMSLMFAGATNANPDVSSWDTSNVIYMSFMFYNATSANPDVSSWDTSNVTDMSYMFNLATSANPDVSSWDTSHVTHMNSMFAGATSANPDVSSWNTSNVIYMSFMFDGATSANPDVSSWDTSHVIDMRYMFDGATSANPDVSSWNTSNVTDMSYMFRGAINADPDLSGWDISNVTDMSSMFDGVTLSTAHYDGILHSWNSQTTATGLTFDGGNSKYCDTTAHDGLTNPTGSHQWTITDGGQDTNCPVAHTAGGKVSSIEDDNVVYTHHTEDKNTEDVNDDTNTGDDTEDTGADADTSGDSDANIITVCHSSDDYIAGRLEAFDTVDEVEILTVSEVFADQLSAVLPTLNTLITDLQSLDETTRHNKIRNVVCKIQVAKQKYSDPTTLFGYFLQYVEDRLIFVR